MKKAQPKVARDIKVIEGELQIALKREIADVIAIGELLLEAQDQLEHGQWLPWLEVNFAASVRTAQNYMSAARFASKYATVAHLKLKPTALYWLGREGTPLDEIEIILKAAETEWVDYDRAFEITEAIHEERRREPPPNDKEHESAEAQAMERVLARVTEGRAAEDEAEAILDGPPPDLGPAPAPTVTDFTLQSFDEAVEALSRLQTKPLSSFIATKHSPDQLMVVNKFLLAVVDRKIRKL